MAKHYIAMAGLHGFIPEICEAFPSIKGAVEYLVFIHELGKNRTCQLKRDQYLELNLKRDRNEYCEIAECDCDTPSDHCDSGEYCDE